MIAWASILLVVVFGFFAGLIAQNYFWKIDWKNEWEKPSASILIPWFLKTKYILLKIRILSLFREKEKFYAEAMKRRFIFSKLEYDLFQGLMREKNSKIQEVIEAVFHVMEKNEKKYRAEQSGKKKKKTRFLVRNYYIRTANGDHMRLSEYCALFVLYNKYLRGEYLEPGKAELGAKFFGNQEEERAALFDKMIVQQEKEQRKKILTELIRMNLEQKKRK